MSDTTRHGTEWFYKQGCRCNDCRAAATAAARRYRARHREVVKAYGRRYYKANAERMRERDRARYQDPKRRASNKAASQRSYERNRHMRIQAATAWNKANPAKRRASHLKSKYGIDPDDYAAMAVAQAGQCGICHKAKLLVVDHDHDSGRVRGLLCRTCNAAIGQLGDNPKLIRRALEWLEG